MVIENHSPVSDGRGQNSCAVGMSLSGIGAVSFPRMGNRIANRILTIVSTNLRESIHSFTSYHSFGPSCQQKKTQPHSETQKIVPIRLAWRVFSSVLSFPVCATPVRPTENSAPVQYKALCFFSPPPFPPASYLSNIETLHHEEHRLPRPRVRRRRRACTEIVPGVSAC